MNHRLFSAKQSSIEDILQEITLHKLYAFAEKKQLEYLQKQHIKNPPWIWRNTWAGVCIFLLSSNSFCNILGTEQQKTLLHIITDKTLHFLTNSPQRHHGCSLKLCSHNRATDYIFFSAAKEQPFAGYFVLVHQQESKRCSWHFLKENSYFSGFILIWRDFFKLYLEVLLLEKSTVFLKDLIAAVIKDFKGFTHLYQKSNKYKEKFTFTASISQLNQYKKHCWTNIQKGLFKNLNFNIYKMYKLWGKKTNA